MTQKDLPVPDPQRATGNRLMLYTGYANGNHLIYALLAYNLSCIILHILASNGRERAKAAREVGCHPDRHFACRMLELKVSWRSSSLAVKDIH